MEITFLCDVMRCSLVDIHRHFEEIRCSYLQGRARLVLLILIYIIVVMIVYFHSVYGVYCVCNFVYGVSFDRCVILCDVCCLCVVSYCSTTATG
jgi:hypothetical protein